MRIAKDVKSVLSLVPSTPPEFIQSRTPHFSPKLSEVTLAEAEATYTGKGPAFLDLNIEECGHDPLDELQFKMSQKDDKNGLLKVKIDKMADSMMEVQYLLEKFILDQREKDI
uniref:Uncharacterized protein n=1 Tax=Romanomermis culicivorax TaxID=13658 RepID=A0A915LDM1_ROMCU